MLIDIGGTSIKVFRQEVFERHLEEYLLGFDENVALLKAKEDIIEEIVKEEDIVAFPGYVKRMNESYLLKSPKFREIKIKAKLVVNDVVALGYYAHKISRTKDVLAVTVGSGLNAIYMNDQIVLTGKYLKRNPEAGHIKFASEGRNCSCGLKDCAELYCSKKFFDSIGEDPKNAEEKVFELFVDNLAEYIATLVKILVPEEVFLFGGICKRIDNGFKEKILKKMPKHYEVDFHLRVVHRRDAVLKGLKEIEKLYPELDLYGNTTHRS